MRATPNFDRIDAKIAWAEGEHAKGESSSCNPDKSRTKGTYNR